MGQPQDQEKEKKNDITSGQNQQEIDNKPEKTQEEIQRETFLRTVNSKLEVLNKKQLEQKTNNPLDAEKLLLESDLTRAEMAHVLATTTGRTIALINNMNDIARKIVTTTQKALG